MRLTATGDLRASRSSAPEVGDRIRRPDSAWHAMPADAVAVTLQVDPTQGLSEPDVTERRAKDGPNELEQGNNRPAWTILREQVLAPMVLILIGAATIKIGVALVTGVQREWIDAGAIGAIILLNVALGFFQEYRAERAIAALRRMAAPVVQVRREGQVRSCPARDLVVGDVILLEAGVVVPADARLVSAAGLQVLEAALTGESASIAKDVLPTPPDAPLADRRNMVFLGTAVASGRATGVVVATGMRTELGRVAALLQGVRTERTPLQRRVVQLGTGLAIAVVLVITAMAGLGIWRGASALDMFSAAVAVAVAAIPEGLPAVLTITLALGAQRMLRRRVLIRRLPAVETLGSVTTICSDKTGTLTENRMQVVVLDVSGRAVDCSESVRGGRTMLAEGATGDVPNDVRALLTTAVLCNDAALAPNSESDAPSALGDPTEAAIVVVGARYHLSKTRLDGDWPRVTEAPFTSERKRMTTVHRVPEATSSLFGPLQALIGDAAYIAAVKGSADGLLSLTTSVLDGGAVIPFSDSYRRRIEAAIDRFAGRGLRVLGVAARQVRSVPSHAETLEADLTFIGLIGLLDPPRPEVREAVAQCRRAGIRPVMITGDHPATALEIARQLGIAEPEDDARTGVALERMSDEQLADDVGRVAVYARVAPEHKLRIVNALQRRGEVVAMTGDGVNDAPALRKASIGVAMGITGTDVSKEAAAMVITDDNFATIVHAVEEGRTIYDNVRKFVKYIVTSNSAEVSVMFLAQLAGMPMPMTTLQILWMNLVTDGVPGLALGLEPTERGIMQRPPFAPGESVFSRGIGRHILLMGSLLTAVAFGMGYWAWVSGRPSWGTVVFVTLTFSQLGHALAVRSHRESFFTLGVRGNPLMLVAVTVTLMLQLLLVYVPAAQTLFGTVPLTTAELVACLAASSVMFWAVELEKWLLRRTEARDGQR